MWMAWRTKIWPLLVLAMAMQVERGWGRAIGEQKKGENEAGHELTVDNFNSSLWATPASWAVVEFYSSWCPACQKFKPHYERVAKLFNGPDAVYPGVVLLAKVDCAEETNQKLCHRFSVMRYPTLLWGKPNALAWGSRESERDTTLEQIPISHGFTSTTLLDWINKRLGRAYSFEAVNEQKLSAQASGLATGQIMASIHDIEESTALAYGIILTNKLLTFKHQGPFVQFLQLLVVHHPSKRCQAGSAEILMNLKDAWPAEHVLDSDEQLTGESQIVKLGADVEALKRLHICGEKLPSGHWKLCNSESSGYSCGLWALFHALSVRVDDWESNSAMKTIRDFVGNFFMCEECREHFLKMSASGVDVVSSRRALALWLWRAHNKVNQRLTLEAASNDVQLSRPKLQWPTQRMCPLCQKLPENKQGSTDDNTEWDEGKVYLFLRKTYGDALDTTSDERKAASHRQLDGVGNGMEEAGTSNAVAVPVGAAAGIAMASCGFGVVACCWRLQQKKRKFTAVSVVKPK